MTELKKKPLFNPEGDLDVRLRRMIGGNTTNLNDFNNMKYAWVSDWYRQAMNNFWIPEEINLSQDVKDYPRLLSAERSAYDKILSFLVFLDSIQTANLPNIGAYITANEVNLCLSIQAFQECVHSQSYSYMLDTICSPVERNDILYQWKTDEHLLRRNTFIGDCYNEFQERKDAPTLLRVMMANYILEGIYFYSGFMFFYNLSRNGKMSGSAQEIRYINRDENTHLWLFRNIITELQKEQPELFTAESVQALREMMREGVEQEIAWGHYVIGDDIPGLNRKMISDYIRYLGNLRWTSLGYPALYPGFESEPESMEWVSQYADANMVKTDFFEARSTAYAKSTALIDDLQENQRHQNRKYTTMNYSAMIQNRRSVHAFREKEVPSEAIGQLRSYYEKTCPRLVPEIATELIVLDKDAQPALESSAGYKQFLIGAPHYLLLMSAPHSYAAINAGYMMEDLVLKLTELDIDTCWMTFTDSDKIKKALSLTTPLEVAAIVAFGYGEKTAKKLRLNILSMSQIDVRAEQQYYAPKKGVHDLVHMGSWSNKSGLDEMMDFYDDMLWQSFYAASLSPSYLNRQPYGFLVQDHSIYLVQQEDAYTDNLDAALDLGIVMLHFSAVASQWAGQVRWELSPAAPDGLPEGLRSAAVYHM